MANPLEITLRVDLEHHLLHVTYIGEFSLAAAEESFQQLLEALVKDKLRKVLVDGRQIVGDPEPLERFYYGKYVADSVSQMINRLRIDVPRFAYVLREPVLDPNRFGETVAVNRGMRVRTFDDLQQAEWWLGISATE
jgi:hypothetical protein